MSNTDYQIQISLNKNTLDALNKGSYYLYVFKAIQSSGTDGRPLLWKRTQDYSLKTVIAWTGVYAAYTSHSKIEKDNTISVGFDTPISPGQILKVDETGTGQVKTQGSPTDIFINNTSTKQFTCGLCQEIDSQQKPFCVFPLYGDSVDIMTPIEKVLLMFSSQEIKEGSVIGDLLQGKDVTETIQGGILIDLTDANQRDVTYDINTNWNWGGSTWAQSVSPTADLVPLLIENPKK